MSAGKTAGAEQQQAPTGAVAAGEACACDEGGRLAATGGLGRGGAVPASGRSTASISDRSQGWSQTRG